MNYYKQGDAAKADKIKAAFEKLGYDVKNWRFTTGVYYSLNGRIVNTSIGSNEYKLILNNPDYKELELHIESKFKVGDWVVKEDGTTFYGGNYAEQITLIEVDEKERMWLSSKTWAHDDDIRLWSIADAKDGDVLATDNGWTCIFKAFDGCVFSSYCFMDSEKWFYELGSEVHTPDSRINGNIHPATKEQRDLLFTKMKEAGYEWDADKKELNKIQPHYDIANFQPRQWVLVRQGDGCAWRLDIFSNLKEGAVSQFECVGNSMVQCIPFDGNKHLLGTTDPCDEQYINW